MKDNYCVIMSGGIGSRFWPFSRENKPKQFLDFFGTGRSLLQQTFDRFSRIIPIENMYIATNEMYADLVKQQLPDLKDNQILMEPTRRNTAPCIAYASFHIQSINPNANIIVTPADHLILEEHNFLRNIQTGLDFVQNNPALLTLGVKPHRPETGYGYIQTTNTQGDPIHKVKAFTEKPNLELAQVFFESGDFFWNSGIFIWSVKSILEAFAEHLPDIHTHFVKGIDTYGTASEKIFIQKEYPVCQNISIDYGIMEKADNVYMLVAEFGWSDLGTWGSLYDLAGKDEQQNATLKSKGLFIESKDNLLTLADGKLAVIQGLEDYIIVESNNVLLICKKSEEQRIKQFVMDVNIQFGAEYL
ncbi:MAG: mannose-1-phosphate guanylyltransferase [Candidatus Ordinivivax streblomastigis]|uniref:mannose-1-phosphate guanylyltransferase n=1 Tax=Candidatus Ordinivivax streblomastigis TaxID=2540710 RepID=A0A5M8P3K3_9BACT|nr:MAG: mannose-1-phosphate guanylyltransferase [Candidatus Ordinivivax streblomastigis]